MVKNRIPVMKNNQANNLFTLITGGSMGIGRAIAYECAGRKMNLLIVALPEPELEITADEIRKKFGVIVHTLGIDLTDRDAPEKVYAWCKENQWQINILVNNAGRAGTAIFEDASFEYNDIRIQLNIRALVCLTHLFLKDLKNLDRSYILNVGSFSAFYAIPYKSVYCASKAFVLRFSRALNAELKNTPVSITVVCPNGVKTNPDTYKRINTHGMLSRSVILTAEEVARIALNGMFKNKVIVIPGFFNKLLLTISKIIPPGIAERKIAKIFRKELI
jgi:short-subunit dehydrogenase